MARASSISIRTSGERLPESGNGLLDARKAGVGARGTVIDEVLRDEVVQHVGLVPLDRRESALRQVLVRLCVRARASLARCSLGGAPVPTTAPKRGREQARTGPSRERPVLVTRHGRTAARPGTSSKRARPERQEPDRIATRGSFVRLRAGGVRKPGAAG
jgi:hypothetical protein